MSRACDSCGSLYEPLRKSSRYCSGKCRKRAQRSGVARPATERAAAAPVATAGTVTAALLKELQEAQRETTSLGQAALVAARRLDASQVESGAAVAALNKDFRAAREAALAKAGPTGDVLDEMARKRQERLARSGSGG